MRRPFAVSIAALCLLGASGGRTERLRKLLAELRRSDRTRFGCLSEEKWARGTGGALAAVRAYQRSRGIASESSARAVLEDLVEYNLRPSPEAAQALRGAVVAAGAPPAAAEDACRCGYYGGGQPEDHDNALA